MGIDHWRELCMQSYCTQKEKSEYEKGLTPNSSPKGEGSRMKSEKRKVKNAIRMASLQPLTFDLCLLPFDLKLETALAP